MPRKTKPEAKAQSPAEQLADYLFTNGMGKKAERLVLWSKDRPDMGGWGKQAVIAAIRKFFPEPKE